MYGDHREPAERVGIEKQAIGLSGVDVEIRGKVKGVWPRLQLVSAQCRISRDDLCFF